MNIFSEFFEKEELSWSALTGICTDGAPAMLGSKLGFATLVKKEESRYHYNYILHDSSRSFSVENSSY